MALAKEKFFCHADIDDIPWQNLIQVHIPVGIESRVNPRAGKQVHPLFIGELIAPAVKAAAEPPCGLQHIGRAAVAAGVSSPVERIQ